VDIAGRVAVVTGGASGIGRSICLAIAGQGAAAVVVADVDAGGAAEVAAAIEAGGQRALAVTADMAREADAEALVTRAEEAFGPVSLFCSNAGIIVDGVLTPDQVAACVIEGIGDERFLILPHPEVAMYEQRRADDRERWLRGMRRLQARLSGQQPS